MHRPHKIVAGVLVSAAITSCALYALADGAAPQLRFFAGLFDKDQTVCIRTAATTLQERKDKIQELISLLDRNDIDPTLGGPQHIAVTLLGRYRAVEAVKPLARHLMYLPDESPTRRVKISATGVTQMYYPCAAALVEIGEPSPVIDEMLQKVEFSNDKEERDLATWVIMQVQGPGQAKVTLTGAPSQPGLDAAAKAHLKNAQTYIDDFRPTYNHPHSNAIRDSRPPLPPGL
jgi:hypothetical protein